MGWFAYKTKIGLFSLLRKENYKESCIFMEKMKGRELVLYTEAH
jgi:hypothetical protein